MQTNSARGTLDRWVRVALLASVLVKVAIDVADAAPARRTTRAG
jgi:hypothetical protein